MKITVVGAGRLGAQIGYTIAQRGLADELVFVDIFEDLAQGQAEDVGQSVAFSHETAVRSGDYETAKDSDIVIITAGKPRTPDMKTRMNLVKANRPIIEDIAKEIVRTSPNAIIITLSNPMDLMNYLVWKATGFPRERVIGSGGQLDSARLKYVLAGKLDAPPARIEAFILGEHGDHQVPVFSRLKTYGKKYEMTEGEAEKVFEATRLASMSVIEKKKGTEFAPASGTADMVESIVRDQKKVIPCSVVLDGEYGITGVSMGVPCVLGKGGCEKVEEWVLTDFEAKKMKDCGDALKEVVGDL